MIEPARLLTSKEKTYANHQPVFGIIIQMFWNEHAPPHFHCRYGEYEAIVNIRTLEVMEGKLPRRVLNLVMDWAELHQAELLEDWNLCEAKQQPKPIAPLE